MVDAQCRGRPAPEQLAAVLAENPARLYGQYSRKGVLLSGSEADITVVDPLGSTMIGNQILQAKNPSSPWHGQQLRGRIGMTFLRGQIIMKDGEIMRGPVAVLSLRLGTRCGRADRQRRAEV